ncbi:MAG TPA: FUSC family protein [Candidatus Acidoferrum sp.]|nr:FUSC family protein [Candidatus Acidoferrum sp.]
MPSDRVRWLERRVVVHSVRTAIAAVVSVLTARLFRLPESYWAPITTLVITQSSLGAALAVSWQRFVGTALGAVVGAIVATQFGPNVLVFGACVFILGPLCVVAHSDRSAYRFGGITVAIVLLVPRTNPAWQVAFHRFAEVTIGIVVALALAKVWPESEDPQEERLTSTRQVTTPKTHRLCGSH